MRDGIYIAIDLQLYGPVYILIIFQTKGMKEYCRFIINDWVVDVQALTPTTLGGFF